MGTGDGSLSEGAAIASVESFLRVVSCREPDGVDAAIRALLLTRQANTQRRTSTCITFALMLYVRRPSRGLGHHTDRGRPHAGTTTVNVLTAHAIVASTSGTGDCSDNAVAESFFATLKAEHVDYENFETRGAGTASVGDYIENFYNCVRRHSHIGYVSPIEFELRSQTQAIAA